MESDRFFERRIGEEEELRELEQPSAPKPEIQGSILSQYGYAPFIIIGGLLFSLTYIIRNPETNQFILTPTQFLMGIVFMVGLELAVKLFRVRLPSFKPPTIKIVPFDSENEVPELQEKFLRMGRNVRILRHVGFPQYDGGDEPTMIHFLAEETLPNGVVQPLSFKMILRDRSIPDLEPNHSHVEDRERNWADFPKHPKVPITRERLFVPKPTFIEAVHHLKEGKEE